jgi:hypothetical protein
MTTTGQAPTMRKKAACELRPGAHPSLGSSRRTRRDAEPYSTAELLRIWLTDNELDFSPNQKATQAVDRIPVAVTDALVATRTAHSNP